MILPLSLAILITVVAILFSGLFSGCEIAFVQSSKVRMEIDAARGGMVDRIIKGFSRHEDMFISTLLVGNNVVLVIYGISFSVIVNPLFEEWFHHSEALTLISNTVFSTAVILLLGEFLPKTVFGINPNSSLKIIALPIYLFYIVLYPISLFTVGLSRLLMRMVGIRNSDKKLRLISIGDLNDYLEETIDDLQDQKEEVENEVKIFRNALDFSQTHVRDCLIPRNEIVAVNIDTVTREELSALFTSSGRSKIIVFRGDIDSVVGYIHVSELFDPSVDWHSRIKPVLYAPENLMANVMMRRLLQQKRSIAVVIDEFGGTAGMLTLEDLVEEIFGNIEDEHDNSGLTAREVAPGIYEFSGRCEIADINERFGFEIPEDDSYQTIAGYILQTTGTIPSQGATVMLGSLRFDIVKKSANRLELIRVARSADDLDAAGQE